jgi:AraC family transcriptional regulator of adaptative response / DNA-3-methyladenine glycosylase II
MPLDPDTCYRALLARDARFDGRFFVGVTTTGIYCRPVCVARTPGRERCRFFRLPVEAERDGFRACFRCRPELAPGGAPIDALPRLVTRAFQRIEAGALSEASVADLATELGVSDRHLRRAIGDELGVAPIELAQSSRLALAKQLVVDGKRSLTEVAFASGFRSVRRFNAAFVSRFGKPPSHFRSGSDGSAALTISLGYREPFAWPALLSFFAMRTLSGIEHVDEQSYARTVQLGPHAGWIRVSKHAMKPLLSVELSHSLARAVMPVAATIRRVFDLNADPASIARLLRRDPELARRLRKLSPRLPGAFDGFEVAVRAIIGQQVSVKAARTIHARLVQRFGDAITTPFPNVDRLHPSAERIAATSAEELTTIGVPKARAVALRALAEAVATNHLRLGPGADPDAARETLLALPGIGPWTAEYVLMRGLGAPDAFPDGDLGLQRAFGVAKKALVARAEAWRPWRAYAAILIWSSGISGG